MERVTIESLYLGEEPRLRDGLTADRDVDKSPERSAQRAAAAFSDVLLRYNAAWAGEPGRQAAADCATGPVRETLSLLTAGTVEEESAGGRVRPGAVIWLLAGVCCLLAAALVLGKWLWAGVALMGAALVCAFLAGRLWRQEKTRRVRPGLSPEAVLRTLRRTAETMDRKIDALCAWQQAREEEQRAAGLTADRPLDPAEARLFGDLLEAAASGRGDFALRQLGQVTAYLRSRGVETREYSPADRELFELLPTKGEPGTLRPALLAGDTLLLQGRATVAEGMGKK